ncbi:hypothetical protein GLOIN_2v1772900 [Rhizophagus clarus]|uniref:DNA-directed DNA polymerase n=1 Tax=Rhizophagus clarus TaxID=94130 RepID=A0A8H3M5L2_9GLOM|nr:hypothetical protein GLOIN_2v1772900 [Rhizophagus clarus]
MSRLLGSITGTLGRLFRNFLPSWRGPVLVPPELPEPSEPPVPEEEPEADSEGDSEKQGINVEFYDGSTQWTGSEIDFCDLSQDWFLIKANLNETLQEAHKRYNEEASAIAWQRALTWAEPYKGIATELDFNEYYPHILSSYMSGWPVRAGEFKTITHIRTDSIKDHLKYGIYRVFIEGQPAEQKCTRGFRYNPAGYYTHYDLLIAMDLGLHIELSSESPN